MATRWRALVRCTWGLAQARDKRHSVESEGRGIPPSELRPRGRFLPRSGMRCWGGRRPASVVSAMYAGVSLAVGLQLIRRKLRSEATFLRNARSVVSASARWICGRGGRASLARSNSATQGVLACIEEPYQTPSASGYAA